MRENFKKIIEESGNNLHIDTVDLLERMQWDVDLHKRGQVPFIFLKYKP